MTRDERLAKNEALFRQVNERLLEVSTLLGTADSDRGRYLVVEKFGVPGEIAEDTDPRD